VYVLGTGIDKSHPTFEDRAEWGFDAVTLLAEHDAGDPHGHGTYVAGTLYMLIILNAYFLFNSFALPCPALS
jgi:subtilisin family serine protease